MRKLNKKFEEKLETDYKKIIDYVRNNDDTFLGIRNNCINLYANGGSFLRISQEKEGYKAYIEEKYFHFCPKEKPKILDQINDKIIVNINDWINILDSLKECVKKYQNREYDGLTKIAREKILQQKLIKEFNSHSDYYAYDMEYNLEGANDYVYDTTKTPIENKKTVTPGRTDILLMGKPNNKKITIYFMEVKEGNGAFSGVSVNNLTFGSGIVGHIKNYIPLLNLAKNSKLYISRYQQEKNGVKAGTFDVRKILLEELKYTMNFYKKFGLIRNKDFQNIDYDSLELDNKDNGIKFVFFLGNYQNQGIGSFENHLGIRGGKAPYSVKNLLDNKMKKQLNLDFISYDELFDFQYYKESKNYNDNGFNLKINEYPTIKKEEFNERE